MFRAQGLWYRGLVYTFGGCTVYSSIGYVWKCVHVTRAWSRIASPKLLNPKRAGPYQKALRGTYA